MGVLRMTAQGVPEEKIAGRSLSTMRRRERLSVNAMKCPLRKFDGWTESSSPTRTAGRGGKILCYAQNDKSFTDTTTFREYSKS